MFYRLMSFLFWTLIAIHVIGCLVLILLVLIQNDKAGGLSATFGGTGGQAFTSAGAATFISKLTKWWAIGLFVVIVAINLLVSRAHFGRETTSEVQGLIKDGGAKVLQDMGAKESVTPPAGLPGVPAAPVPGIPAAPAQ
jgi:preprotein translocase subunit SecG